MHTKNRCITTVVHRYSILQIPRYRDGHLQRCTTGQKNKENGTYFCSSYESCLPGKKYIHPCIRNKTIDNQKDDHLKKKKTIREDTIIKLKSIHLSIYYPIKKAMQPLGIIYHFTLKDCALEPLLTDVYRMKISSPKLLC